jgi:hypothetical protein
VLGKPFPSDKMREAQSFEKHQLFVKSSIMFTSTFNSDAAIADTQR